VVLPSVLQEVWPIAYVRLSVILEEISGTPIRVVEEYFQSVRLCEGREFT